MPLILKEIPAPTLSNLIPPNKNHEYFAHAAEFPFNAQASSFSYLNAWWLSEVSLLAYAGEAFSRGQYNKLGLDMKFIPGPKTGTECFVVSSDKFIWVAFRGTQINPASEEGFKGIFKDFMTDGKIILKDSPYGGAIHTGFAEALDEVWEKLTAKLAQLQAESSSRTLWFTGHSLGGGIATLAADRCAGVKGLYLFGSPCAGNQAFADDFHVNSYRIVNNNDIIARIPPYPYVHVGQFKYIDAEGELHDNPKFWELFLDRSKGQLNTVLNYAGNLRHGWNTMLPLDRFNDHAPIFYALHLWNCFVRSR